MAAIGRCTNRHSCSVCDATYSVGQVVTCYQNHWDLLIGELNEDMDPFFIGGLCGASLLLPTLIAILLWINYGSKVKIIKKKSMMVSD